MMLSEQREETPVKLSTDRILTTHVGSLPRPRSMLDLIAAREAGQALDEAAFEARSAEAVRAVVAQQVACGIDVVSDGEQSKPSYATYVKHRIAGIDMDPSVIERGRDVMLSLDRLEHPDFQTATNFSNTAFPACLGPLSYENPEPLERDLAHFAVAVAEAAPTEAFMTAPSPGILTRFVVDTYYKDEDAYVDALAAAMRTEYRAVVDAGFILQIDCPDLGSCRHNQYRHLSDTEFRRIAQRNIAALNAATEGLPPDRMRLHICWGNYEGPHTHDIALKDIIDIALRRARKGSASRPPIRVTSMSGKT
jgi:5-methyltetrahydropteroyltriglutamate--homocysteine methyltransferase